MSKDESLDYEVQVEENEEYSIKVRVGDGQDGDHNVFGTCPFIKEPKNDDPEWISYLGFGSEIKGTYLSISTATQDNNPYSNKVSVRLFINNQQIKPYKGQNEFTVNHNEIVYFNQKIFFI